MVRLGLGAETTWLGLGACHVLAENTCYLKDENALISSKNW